MATFDKSCVAAVVGLVGLGVVTAGGDGQVKVGLVVLAVAVAIALVPENWFKRPVK